MKDLAKHVIIFGAVACIIGGTALMCFVPLFWIAYVVLFVAALCLGITAVIRSRFSGGIAVVLIAVSIPFLLFFGPVNDRFAEKKPVKKKEEEDLTREEREYLKRIRVYNTKHHIDFLDSYCFECTAENMGKRDLSSITVTFRLLNARDEVIMEKQGISNSYLSYASYLLEVGRFGAGYDSHWGLIRPGQLEDFGCYVDRSKMPSEWDGRFYPVVTGVKFAD